MKRERREEEEEKEKTGRGGYLKTEAGAPGRHESARKGRRRGKRQVGVGEEIENRERAILYKFSMQYG